MRKGPETSNVSFTQRQCGFLSGEGRVMRCGEVCRTLKGQRACKVKPWGDPSEVGAAEGRGQGSYGCRVEDGRALGWGP